MKKFIYKYIDIILILLAFLLLTLTLWIKIGWFVGMLTVVILLLITAFLIDFAVYLQNRRR